MISSINELKGSIRKENGTERLTTLIQSKRGIVNDLTSEAFNSANMPTLIPKESNTHRQPINPTTPFGNTFLPKPLIRKPPRGNKGINQTKFIIFNIYTTILPYS